MPIDCLLAASFTWQVREVYQCELSGIRYR